jgi:DNA end-binding protein Ku
MARAFWTGNVSFGLVEVPVRLMPATQSDDLSFTLLDREDLSPVGYRRYNRKTGEEVPWERIVRGYEHEKNEYVVLGDQDFERANVEATHSIEIIAFVDANEIDPMYYDTPYYIEPLKKSSKSYALLHETLSRANKVGIARVVLRTRQHLAALSAKGPALVLDLLRYRHELRDVDDLDLPDSKSRAIHASPQEIKMAQRLIDDMTERWDPSRYHDEYRDDLMKAIEEKIASGKSHVITPEGRATRRTPRGEVMDIMQLLKKSLAARGRTERAAPQKLPKTRARPERRRAKSA